MQNASFEYKLIGEGEQTVVFFNGFRMNFESWDSVYPDISNENQILLFNRLGVGSSKKAKEKQTGRVVVNDINKLFKELNLKPPYIIVAHSLGGIFATLYAQIFPREISSIVFVDSPHPEEIKEQKKHQPPLILNSINNTFKMIEKRFDKFKFSEDECIEETIQEFENLSGIENIPITVISGTKKMPFVPEDLFIIHQNYQRELLKLSNKSKHYKCDKSGHFPQITEPKMVIHAIKESIEFVNAE